ncbi:MAG: hypothetical protein Q9210_003952 [Variospora velana]
MEALQADGSVPWFLICSWLASGIIPWSIDVSLTTEIPWRAAADTIAGHFVVAVFDDMRHDVTTNDSLENIGNRNQLECFITRAPGVVWVTKKTMTATVEAIVGAAYEDGGMDAAKKVVEKLSIAALEQEAKAEKPASLPQRDGSAPAF